MEHDDETAVRRLKDKKKKKRQKVAVPTDQPPTLGEYLSHLFDRNAMRTVEPAALTDAQFYWLLNDLGLGLFPDEITVLCRRAPAANGKVLMTRDNFHRGRTQIDLLSRWIGIHLRLAARSFLCK